MKYLISIAVLLALRCAAADAPPAPPLPKIRHLQSIPYPDAQKRIGLEGRVLLAFNIADNGEATDAQVIFADEAAFDTAAITLLSGLRFDIPYDWTISGNRFKRFHLGIVFCIPPSGQSDAFSDIDSPIIVMTDRIAGSPMRHPLGHDASGKCAVRTKQ
jgi:TonB family protein